MLYNSKCCQWRIFACESECVRQYFLNGWAKVEMYLRSCVDKTSGGSTKGFRILGWRCNKINLCEKVIECERLTVYIWSFMKQFSSKSKKWNKYLDYVYILEIRHYVVGVISWILYCYVAINVVFSYLHTTWRMFVRFLRILTRFVYMNRSNVFTWFAYRTLSSRPEASAVRWGESEYQQPRSHLNGQLKLQASWTKCDKRTT